MGQVCGLSTLQPCSLETETTAHFFLCCDYYYDIRKTLMNELHKFDNSISLMEANELLRIILYGNERYDIATNNKNLTASIEFIKKSMLFEEALF